MSNSDLETFRRLEEAVAYSALRLSSQPSSCASSVRSSRSSTCSAMDFSSYTALEALFKDTNEATAAIPEQDSLPSRAERTLSRRTSIRRQTKQVRSRSERQSRHQQTSMQQVAEPRFMRVEKLLAPKSIKPSQPASYVILDTKPSQSEC
eukprot:TRINITY_DN23913_c0_g1_i1.p1 TRINITY_DN23913_c0_g1~~TRINITY_DN23913_c0_g1_i1.p1  ORF type:complete len:150 (+),score=9.32 TRINITY_DN23913_c0_g1_i1:111-560(+)